MSDVSQAREQAYLDLLHQGLVILRNSAQVGNTQILRIEADHLHNIPTLIHETNERRHEYYICAERRLYIQRLCELEATEYMEQAILWYACAWQTLASAAGVQLTPWDQEI